MATRMLPARHVGRLGKVIAEPKKQLALGELVTCEAARVLHAVKGKAKRKSGGSELEEAFDFQCRTRGLPPYLREHRFAKESLGRAWKFDFCWLQYKIAVELEGLVMRKLYDQQHQLVWAVYGRHATIAGIREDMSKYNAAALLGWTVLRFEQQMVKDDTAIAETMRVLCSRGWIQ